MSTGVANLAGTVEGRSAGATTSAQGIHKTGGQKLWKVSGRSYDLTKFLPRHPGGARILLLAREHFPDSTLVFEAHHINMSRALTVLRKYEVPDVDVVVGANDSSRGGKPAGKPAGGSASRASSSSAANAAAAPRTPMLSADDSFFNELKRRVGKHLDSTKRGAGPTDECLVAFAATLSCWLILFGVTAVTGQLAAAVGTGLCGALLAGFGHNWAHQPKYDGWAWVLDLEGNHSQNWFVAHVLQHHMYTNLPGDSHFRILEPFLVTDPAAERNWVQSAVMPWLTPVVFFFGCFVAYIVNTLQMILGVNFDPDHPQHITVYATHMLLYAQLAVLLYLHGGAWGFALFMAKNGVASIWYLVLAFINHNTDDAWNLESRAKATDWAQAQLCASTDIGRDETFVSSAAYLWLNYHTVHHLFPHTDMSKHPAIQSILIECAEEYGLTYSRGKGFPELYAEMIRSFKTPRDVLGVLANIHI